VWAIFLLPGLLGVGLAAQEEPVTPPGSQERRLVERIQAEGDPGRQVPLLVEFTQRFADTAAAHWAWERLQSVHMDRGDLPQALETGQQILDLYPEDIDAAANCLKAAQGLKIAELVRRYAVETWKRASWMASKAAPEGQYARQVMSNAEFALVAQTEDPDPQTSQAARRSLAGMRPSFSTASDTGTADRYRGPADVVALLQAAEHDLQRGQSLSKVLETSGRVLNQLAGAPDSERYRAAAWWLGGVSASLLGRYALADQQLRQALPFLRSTPEALATALYHLGYANYWLAEMGERERIFDALKYNQQCAGIPGPYQQIAIRTIASIRSQYNMQAANR
jgi:tetratricopeptide (TPR) repeat protein